MYANSNAQWNPLIIPLSFCETHFTSFCRPSFTKPIKNVTTPPIYWKKWWICWHLYLSVCILRLNQYRITIYMAKVYKNYIRYSYLDELWISDQCEWPKSSQTQTNETFDIKRMFQFARITQYESLRLFIIFPIPMKVW